MLPCISQFHLCFLCLISTVPLSTLQDGVIEEKSFLLMVGECGSMYVINAIYSSAFLSFSQLLYLDASTAEYKDRFKQMFNRQAYSGAVTLICSIISAIAYEICCQPTTSVSTSNSGWTIIQQSFSI